MTSIQDISNLMHGTGVRTTNKKVLQEFVEVLRQDETPQAFGLFETMWISGTRIKGTFPTLYLTSRRVIAVQNDPTFRLSFQPKLNFFPFDLGSVTGCSETDRTYDIRFADGQQLTLTRLAFRKDRTSTFFHNLNRCLPPGVHCND